MSKSTTSTSTKKKKNCCIGGEPSAAAGAGLPRGLVIRSRDEAESAMAIVASAEVQKKEIDGRAARYRLALAQWAMRESAGRIELRHGWIHIRSSPHEPLVFIQPNTDI